MANLGEKIGTIIASIFSVYIIFLIIAQLTKETPGFGGILIFSFIGGIIAIVVIAFLNHILSRK